MSSQTGNTVRSRPQKYKNKSAFKNNLHDTSQRTKAINSMSVGNVCQRCKDIIEWKIKYKKYKPLSQPKTCVKCASKTIRKAYHTICDSCRKSLGVCAKCGELKEVIEERASGAEETRLDEEMKCLLKLLPERKRRTFNRYMNKLGTGEKQDDGSLPSKEDLLNKLNALNVGEDEEGTDSEEEGEENDDCSG